MPNLCIIPARALFDPELTYPQLRALLAVGLHTDRYGDNVWASNSTLAAEARMDVRDLRRCLRELEEMGYLSRIRRVHPGGGTATSLISVRLDDPIPTEPVVAQVGGGLMLPSPRGGGVVDPGGEGAGTPGGRGPQPLPGRGPEPRGGRGPGPLQTTPINAPSERPSPPPPQNADRREAYLTFPHDLMQAAYEELLGSAQSPTSVDAYLRGLTQGLGNAVGKPVGLHDIGMALMELQANGHQWNGALFRGYLRKQQETQRKDVASEAAAATQAAAPKKPQTWDEVIAFFEAEEAREKAAKGVAHA